MDFDVFVLWKVNNLKYRVLSKMSRDILAIPVTIAALESTFSVGDRVINPLWSLLSTKTMQMLLCKID